MILITCLRTQTLEEKNCYLGGVHFFHGGSGGTTQNYGQLWSFEANKLFSRRVLPDQDVFYN